VDELFPRIGIPFHDEHVGLLSFHRGRSMPHRIQSVHGTTISDALRCAAVS
jgi:hypothetical protein